MTIGRSANVSVPHSIGSAESAGNSLDMTRDIALTPVAELFAQFFQKI